MTTNEDCVAQPCLLEVAPDVTFTEDAQARVHYGLIVEELVCAALDLIPLKINGKRDICFDAKSKSTYYEIKSLAYGSDSPIYGWRVKKEIESGHTVTYAFLEHKAKKCKGTLDLLDVLAVPGNTRLTLVDLNLLVEFRKSQPIAGTKGKPNSGYARGGYARGYRSVSPKKLVERHEADTRVSSLTVELYDRRFSMDVYKVGPKVNSFEEYYAGNEVKGYPF